MSNTRVSKLIEKAVPNSGDWVHLATSQGSRKISIEDLNAAIGADSLNESYTLVTDSDSPYSAAADDDLLVDTSNDPVTITLPASPQAGDKIMIIPYKDSYSTNNLTIDNNGNMIGGNNDSATVSKDGLALEMSWLGGTIGWAAISRGDTLHVQRATVVGADIVEIKDIDVTSYTILANDRQKLLRSTTSSATTFTLPDSSTVEKGFSFQVVQGGTGDVSFSTQGSDTIQSLNGNTTTAGQGGEVTVYLLDSSTWWIGGDLQ